MLKKFFMMIVMCVLGVQLLVFAQVTAPVAKSSSKPAAAVSSSQPKQPDYYQMLNSTEPAKRRMAISNIGNKRDPKDIPVLINALKDTDAGVKIAACELLGLSREQSAADPIMALLTDKEPQVRQSACVALGFIGDPKVQPALIERVKSDPEPSVRTQAMLILGNMRAVAAVDALIPFAKDNNLDLRIMSVQALGKIADAKAAPAVKEALMSAVVEYKKEQNGYRKGQLKQILAESVRALGAMNDMASAPVIEALLKEDDKSIKIIAADSLGKMGNKSGLGTAMELASDKEDVVRIQAIEAMASIGEKAAIPTLEKIYNTDTNNNVKDAAFRVLTALGWKAPQKPTPVKKAK